MLRTGLAAFLGMLATATSAAEPTTTPPIGLRENTPRIHALVGGKLIVAPGKTVEVGTIVLRDGLISAVGPQVPAPAEAIVWDVSGKTLYPAFIDSYAELPKDTNSASAIPQPGYWNSRVTPERRADAAFKPDAETNKKLRSQGIAVRLAVPAEGIIKGVSALVTTSDVDRQYATVKNQVALHVTLTTPFSHGSEDYPTSPMGALTLVRQAFYDADWYGKAWAAYRAKPGLPRPEQNAALEAMQPYLDGKGIVVIEASDELYFLRAHRMAAEFKLNAIVRGSGDEFRRLDAIRATAMPIILPVSFPKPPNVATPEAAKGVTLERLMQWDLAPENPARLVAAGVSVSFSTHGLKDPTGFLAAARKAVERGLSREAALAALTVAPARMFGVEDRLGTLEVGKAANLLVVEGELFDKEAKLHETWVEGRRYEVTQMPWADPRGAWQVQLQKPDGGSESILIHLTGDPGKLSGKVVRGEKEVKCTHVSLDGQQLSLTFKGEPLGWTGVLQVSATVSAHGTPQASAKASAWMGELVWADGAKSPCEAKPAEGIASNGKPDKPEPDENEKSDAKPAKPPKEALYQVNYPLGAFGTATLPERPDAMVFQNATVWTSSADGVLEGASVLVEKGKITAVGKQIAIPGEAVVVDLKGKHLTPGIIDCHSHIATDGGINEMGQTITAEVRIADFIDPNDVNLYRQLAGGVTVANILHGSANTIGGQNQVIKFRWGALPEEMKFAQSPPGIKFALGENVKQSNWGTRHTRYPQSRMGVEQLVRDAFRAAQDYRRRWDAWRNEPSGLPPRVDLELAALDEVLQGKRLVHCHAYRQDEMLALLRICEEFGVRIATFQHVLEGYKIADALARHGVGGSSFSDWWAYKFEVYDAIPYNGAMLHQAGVVTSFNSDDAELGRRLNLEAAKAIKYGGLAPAEALQFVTLNPARQLGIDRWVGSLEAGKDADLAVWSGSPLSTTSRCEQTWIDGRKHFDLASDQERRKETAVRRAALIQRVLASGEPAAGPGEGLKDPWPREDVVCGHDHQGGHFHE